jgi:hypothetical protein
LEGKPERVVIHAPALSGSSSRVIGARASNSQRHPQVIWLPERCKAKTIPRQRQARDRKENLPQACPAAIWPENKTSRPAGLVILTGIAALNPGSIATLTIVITTLTIVITTPTIVIALPTIVIVILTIVIATLTTIRMVVSTTKTLKFAVFALLPMGGDQKETVWLQSDVCLSKLPVQPCAKDGNRAASGIKGRVVHKLIIERDMDGFP